MTTFAGFEYPRTIAQLPKGTPKERLAKQHALQAKYGQHYKRVTGPYTQSKPALNVDGKSFYLDSDFMIGLRWTWADQVEGVRIDHKGWYDNDFGDGDTIRGIVFRLNHGRGFLAGWSYPEGMAGEVEYTIHKDESTAAYAADQIADRVAEKARDADAKHQKEQREAEKKEEEEKAQRNYVNEQLEKAGWV